MRLHKIWENNRNPWFWPPKIHNWLNPIIWFLQNSLCLYEIQYVFTKFTMYFYEIDYLPYIVILSNYEIHYLSTKFTIFTFHERRWRKFIFSGFCVLSVVTKCIWRWRRRHHLRPRRFSNHLKQWNNDCNRKFSLNYDFTISITGEIDDKSFVEDVYQSDMRVLGRCLQILQIVMWNSFRERWLVEFPK